jgi:hypothetical protein
MQSPGDMMIHNTIYDTWPIEYTLHTKHPQAAPTPIEIAWDNNKSTWEFYGVNMTVVYTNVPIIISNYLCRMTWYIYNDDKKIRKTNINFSNIKYRLFKHNKQHRLKMIYM